MLNILVGFSYSFLALVMLPLYIAIIYLFITKHKYRKYSTYALMSQMGIAQCILSPGHFFTGLAVALKVDYLNTASFFINPYADFKVFPATYTTAYNDNLPATVIVAKVSTSTTLTTSAVTFVVYVVIVSRLIQHKLQNRSDHIALNEKTILLQVAVKFLGDTSMTLLYHVAPHFVGRSDWMSILTYIGYTLVNITLPPIFFLIISRKLRNEVFSIFRWTTLVSSLTT
ncbi:hypothetical protein L596_026675 [Steinernema carpocapsae]|uniref:Serpentine receptor class gamma n=1 Tax=Steinernema carpocapsae TaxID=34508 RepID=A0A4U5M244_STECR|nr:hypothetical protein L596_026675 [Steinernema carpocapsae]